MKLAPRSRRDLRATLVALCLSLCFGLGLPTAASAVVLNVDTLLDVVNAGDGVLSLREALAAASAGDEIQFDGSLNGGTIVLGGSELVVSVDLSLSGPGPSLLAIDANAQSRVLTIASGVMATVSGLTLTNGATASGAGLNNLGNLDLSDCVISNSSSPNTVGAGLSTQGSLTMTRCDVVGNTGEGIRAQTGLVTIVESTVSGSTSTGLVAASGSSPIVIVRSTFSGNSGGAGGAINNSSGGGVSITLINSTVSGNTSSNLGGGIYAGSAPLNVYSSTISDNTSGNNGGGIASGSFGSPGDITIRNSIVIGNFAVTEDDCSVNPGGGTWVTDGSNLFGAGTGCPLGASDVTTATPASVLDVLADTGGPTQVHWLLGPPNPAVDGGPVGGCKAPDGSLLASDQQNEARHWGPRCDIGSVEIPVSSVPVLPTAWFGLLASTLLGSASWLVRSARRG